MSTVIQTCIPRVVVAGDTVSFQISNTQYPSSTYTMAFLINDGTDAPQSFAAVAQTDGSFIVTVNAASTENILPEQYNAAFVYTSIATNPTTRKSIPAGLVWVTPDFTDTVSPSPNQILLSTLQDTQKKLAGGTIMSATINQQTWTKKNLKQLQDQINITTTQVRREAEQLARLLGQPNTNITQFFFAYQNYYPYPGSPWGAGWNGGIINGF